MERRFPDVDRAFFGHDDALREDIVDLQRRCAGSGVSSTTIPRMGELSEALPA